MAHVTCRWLNLQGLAPMGSAAGFGPYKTAAFLKTACLAEFGQVRLSKPTTQRGGVRCRRDVLGV